MNKCKRLPLSPAEYDELRSNVILRRTTVPCVVEVLLDEVARLREAAGRPVPPAPEGFTHHLPRELGKYTMRCPYTGEEFPCQVRPWNNALAVEFMLAAPPLDHDSYNPPAGWRMAAGDKCGGLRLEVVSQYLGYQWRKEDAV
jgi:hypothetical protein